MTTDAPNPDAPIWSAKDEAIIEIMAGGATFQQAADAVGVSKSTITRKMQDPVFKAEVGAKSRREYESLSRKARARLEKHIDALCAVFTDPDATYAEKNANYRTLMDLADKAVHFEIAARLDALGFPQR